MPMKLGTLDGDITAKVRRAIEQAIPGSEVTVTGGRGHFSIEVTSAAFSGKNALQSQRMVYSAIKHFMAGDDAPVHAVDSLKVRVPS
jgi:acid stress-induced BolA-like protein IbaG/YrbA